jgi:hypothetical protein
VEIDNLSTIHTRGQSPKAIALQNAYMAILFLPRRRTLEGGLGWIGMETQNMVQRSSIFFHKKQKTDKILAIRLKGLFWAKNKVGCSYSLGMGLDFGFGLRRLHTMLG